MEPIIDLTPCAVCSQPLGPPRGLRAGGNRRFCAQCGSLRNTRHFNGYLGPTARRRRRASRSAARLARETQGRSERTQAKAISRGRERLIVPIDDLAEDLALLVAQQAAEDTHHSSSMGLPSFLTEEYPE